MPYRLESFGSTPIPHYNGRHDISTAPTTARGVKVGSGEYDLYGNDKAPADALTISLSGWLFGTSLESDFRALRARGRDKDVLWRLWDDGKREWTTARLLAVPGERTAESFRTIQPSLSFYLPLPVWYADVSGGFTAVDLFDQDDDDLLTLGVAGDAVDGTTTFLLVHRGNINSTKVTFTITSGTGTISTVTLTNVTTGHVLKWTGLLTTGQWLVLNAGNSNATQQGTSAYSFVNTTLTSGYSASATSFVVGSTTVMQVGGGVAITLDTGAVFLATIATIPDSTHFSITGSGLPSAAASGNAVTVGLTEPTDKERWFELAPGTNVVTLAWTDSATTDTSTIAFTYAHTSA